MDTSAASFYQEKADKYSSELNAVSQKVKWFAWYRFLAFVFIFLPLFISGVRSIFTLIFSLGSAVLFFFLVKKNIQLENQKRKLTVLVKLSKDELLALSHSFSHFRGGAEFLNTSHFYSYDLDLFGEGSIYQFLNRTATKTGSRKLANWLISPPILKKEIERKQKAVKELTNIPEWRLHFLAEGQLFEETDEMNDEIHSWSDMEIELNNAGKIKWLIRIVPICTVLATIPSVLGITHLFLIFFVFTQWIFVFIIFWKRINQFFRFFGRKSDLLAKYMRLLNYIEEREFHSEYLVELNEKVSSPVASSKVFSQLKSLVKEFEFRQNLLMGFILNSLFLWDIRCVYKLWLWHQKNHSKLWVWLETISEMDALISLGNYAFNHPEFDFPEIKKGDFVLNAEDLGHPLLHPDKRISNNLFINGWSKIMIITGANMAGKSTFLRTVGVNLILGRIGVPVCATRMIFTPVEIYTNMRTTDSLLKDESYFYAELKRLKGVLDRLQNGERIFVILDEMLKGTNSVDKLSGSKEIIRRLMQFQSVSLIATHDLKLAEMESEFPTQILNTCFEIRIENDELVFDYRLSQGVTKTMNATFLMKKMGII